MLCIVLYILQMQIFVLPGIAIVKLPVINIINITKIQTGDMLNCDREVINKWMKLSVINSELKLRTWISRKQFMQIYESLKLKNK